MKTHTETFELMVDGNPVSITATPYFINNDMEKRFRVSYNGGPVYIFAWDEDAHKLFAMKDNLDNMPANLEQAIARELESLTPA